jgi:CO dehydrogenase/acetyl-CoA synthase gamma subunit (corrinoid Fe-S protein)
MILEKLADGTIVEIVKVTVDDKKLIKQKKALQEQIDRVQQLKTEPDKETLDFWNSLVRLRGGSIEKYKEQIAIIDKQLDEINAVK